MAGPPLLTLIVAHAAWTMTDHCVPVPNVMTLGDLAKAFAARRLRPTLTVVSGWVHAGRTCIESFPLFPHPKPLLISSWSDLQSLTGTQGWSVVSASRTYTDFDEITAAQRVDEACGSLQDLRTHHIDAHGMYAYANNVFGAAGAKEAQRLVVLPCGYRWGRMYGYP